MGRILQQRYKDAQLLKVVFKAITVQCLECAGGTVLERKFCSCQDSCELWSYRFGCDPSKVNPSLLDKKNFVEGAMFGFDKEVKVCEKVFLEGKQ
jgi:hypothetical protein